MPPSRQRPGCEAMEPASDSASGAPGGGLMGPFVGTARLASAAPGALVLRQSDSALAAQPRTPPWTRGSETPGEAS